MSNKSELNVAILQVDLVWEDPVANKQQFEKLIAEVAEESDLVVLPEMFTTGFSMQADELYEAVDGPSTRWMQHMAAKHQLAITGSLIIKENDKYYNRLLFVYPETL